MYSKDPQLDRLLVCSKDILIFTSKLKFIFLGAIIQILYYAHRRDQIRVVPQKYAFIPLLSRTEEFGVSGEEIILFYA